MFTGLIRRFSTEETQLSSQDAGTMSANHHKDGINDVFNPTIRTASPFRPPPLDPVVLLGYRDSTTKEGRLLNNAVAEEIRTMVPERLRITENWRLVYSLEQDGSSLNTLYGKSRGFEGRRVGFVLVVKDEEGGVSAATDAVTAVVIF